MAANPDIVLENVCSAGNPDRMLRREHVIVYREADRWAGVPANYGIWSWGDEIVVGFVVGRFNADGGFHARDMDYPFVAMQARSLDGGHTWEAAETPCRVPGDCRSFSADEHMRSELGVGACLGPGKNNQPEPCPGNLDFTHPDFALMGAKTGLGAGTVSWFYTSTDRCRRWEGPYSLPDFGYSGVEARTDYLVEGPSSCLLFLTGSQETGGEGGTVFAARTVNGGASFEQVARVANAPIKESSPSRSVRVGSRLGGAGYDRVDSDQREAVFRGGGSFVIMPASVRIDERRILVAVRCREHRSDKDTTAPCWIDLYLSEDNAASWRRLCRPAPNTGGNPPTLTKLLDGRICLTYGYRNPPYGMHGRLSEDGGATWGDEIVLRADAGTPDIGYPRAVQRPDGTIVSVYWWADSPGGERYVAATLWKP